MLSIRLMRMGAKKKPFYRVVVADKTMPRDGRFVDIIGYYNPLTEPAEVRIDEEKLSSWVEKGAKPTDTVRSLVKRIKKAKVGTDS
jgi:small subunit ribosomal protein S16